MADQTLPTAVAPEDLSAPVVPDDDGVLAAMLGADSWENATPSLVDDFSPFSPDLMQPYLSTPQDWTMDTPLFEYLDESQMLSGPFAYSGALFPKLPEWGESGANPKSVPKLDESTLFTISPSSPLLDSFDPAELFSTTPSNAPSGPSTVKPTVTRRKVGATGIRKGVTPESLLDENAPTQSRNYITPSATSRKDIPAVFARKRGRSIAFGDEEDQLDDYVLPPNPTEKDLIEQKRRQNTVAARRSRKRKLEHVQLLEKSLEEERQQKEQWRQRTLMLSSMLTGLGHPVPDFSDEDS